MTEASAQTAAASAQTAAAKAPWAAGAAYIDGRYCPAGDAKI